MSSQQSEQGHSMQASCTTLSSHLDLCIILWLLLSAACCRAQSDKIFSQQSSLGKAQEEVRALRGQLEARAAQQGVIEGEIRRQVEEYGRLKRQLVDQEELQVGCGRQQQRGWCALCFSVLGISLHGAHPASAAVNASCVCMDVVG
jgi:hypothetical protein